MYRIKIIGPKKAVLMTRASAVGYGAPDIQLEEGTDEQYTMVCESETKWDVSPFDGAEEDWNGEKYSLDAFSEDTIREMECDSELVGRGLKYITGSLGVEVRMINIPDDDGVPGVTVYQYKNGEELGNEFVFMDDENPDPDEIADKFLDDPSLYV